MNASEEPMVRPVCLPERNLKDTYVGENATVIGWGNLRLYWLLIFLVS